MATRPYSAFIPAPLYPSTPRVQKQFTVEYVYNYAESAYTPPVALPLTGRGAAKRDTPEAAAAAFYSAMRSGDYEGWLLCWEPTSRAALVAMTKEHPEGAEFWRAGWRKAYTAKNIVLVDRVETVNYIILDTRTIDAAKPGPGENHTLTLVSTGGAWLATNQFSDDGLGERHYAPPEKPNSVTHTHSLIPLDQLQGPGHLLGQAQNDFYARHTTSSTSIRTVE